jgi:hypothetical protein
MRVKLQDVGGFTCVPLPADAASHPAFTPGAEVEVIWDPARAQLVVRTIGASRAMDDQFADAFEMATSDFLQRYEQALHELAAL